jgi:hypothetical protein
MNAVFWDVTPYGSSKNRSFGGTYHLHHQGNKKHVLRLLVTANVPNSPTLVTLMMEDMLFLNVGSYKSHTA